MANKLVVDKDVVRDEWDLPYGGNYEEGVEVLEDEIIGTSRWSVHHALLVNIKGTVYRTTYSVGSTEYQDEQPWQDDSKVIFTPQKKVTKTIEVWEDDD